MGKASRIVQVLLDPRWWGFYLQRRVTHPSHRMKIADKLTRLRPKANIINESLAQVGAAALRESGLHPLGQLLRPEQCLELFQYFSARHVRDPYRPTRPRFLPLSDARPEGAHIAHHDAVDIIAAPYILDIANDSRILDVVAEFLGCRPTIGYMATWWSYPTCMGPVQAENFHRDIDDWRFVKLFIYLTPVTEESGPHKYVQHSSRHMRLTQIRRFTDDEVSEAYGSDNIKTMISNAGEGFLEDTYGIHKGQSVVAGHRLLFQVVYTLTPLPYAPTTPVAVFPTDRGYDRWTNRVYLK